MDQKVFFIINKFSGRRYRESLQSKILAACQRCGLEASIAFTNYPGHATELAEQAARQHYPKVFAVGGDGTVNEAANGLVHSESALGIIPAGSGNGLARHLKIPMHQGKALELLRANRTIRMDALRINDRYSFNVCGLGFDGHVAKLFGQDGKRGLIGYIKIIAREFPRFKAFAADLEVDGQPLVSSAFIIAFANSSQFGNGATIAPSASICDGRMDLCLIGKPSYLQAGNFIGQLFTRRLDRSKIVRMIRATEFSAVLAEPQAYHIDGEPFAPTAHFSVSLEPACINILVPTAAGRV